MKALHDCRTKHPEFRAQGNFSAKGQPELEAWPRNCFSNPGVGADTTATSKVYSQLVAKLAFSRHSPASPSESLHYAIPLKTSWSTYFNSSSGECKLLRYYNHGYINKQAAALCLIPPTLSEKLHTRNHEEEFQPQLLGTQDSSHLLAEKADLMSIEREKRQGLMQYHQLFHGSSKHSS